MLVQYNGINLEVERVVQWSDRNIMSEDGSERLMRHVSLAVQCVVNPSATTVPGLNAMSAPQIIASLKQRLLALRGSLIVTIGGREVVRSPARAVKAGTPQQADNDGVNVHYCDARGGPVPLHCDVTSIHGLKTMLVTFAVETWLVESVAPGGEAEQSALVSHRWTESCDLSPEYCTTRIIRGRAVFRADHLCDIDGTTGGLRYGQNPSDYIAELNHPLPNNYRRQRVSTTLSSDGLTLDYTIVDEEQERTVEANSPVAWIQGSWSSGVAQPDPTAPATTWTKISVTVRGRRGATDVQLVRAALKACVTYDKAATLQRRWYWSNTISVDMAKKQVHLDLGWTRQGWIPLAVDGALLFGGADRPANIATADVFLPEDIEGGLGNSVATPTVGQQPLQGMLGGNNDTPGGQPRMAPQQMNDGAIVPARTPTRSLAKDTQDDDIDDAQRARGENQRPAE